MTASERLCARSSRRSDAPRAVLLRHVPLRADGTLGPIDDDLEPARSHRFDGGVVRPVTIPALAGIGAGAIHAAAVGAHADHRVLANIFVILAVAQLATGVALLVRPSRVVAKAVVAVNGFAVAGWLLTRTVGVFVIAGLGVERPGFADTACALLGALAAVGAAMVLSSDTRSGVASKWRPATSARELLVPSIVVVLLAVPAMSWAATDVHEHGATGADHAHEAVDDAGSTEPAAPATDVERPAEQVSSITNAGNGVDEDGGE